jgi:hypothetical protein
MEPIILFSSYGSSERYSDAFEHRQLGINLVNSRSTNGRNRPKAVIHHIRMHAGKPPLAAAVS